MMRSQHCIYAANDGHFEIAPEFGDREVRELWRTLARPVTVFDEASPANFSPGEIGEFFRNWRAVRDEFRNWALNAA